MLSDNLKSFLLIGGDERQLYSAEKLKEYGFEVILYGFDKLTICCNDEIKHILSNVDAVVLPLPFTRDGTFLNAPFSNEPIPTDKLLENLSKDIAVFCGNMDSKIKKDLFSKGIRVFDYYERDETVVRNAVPTAEGVAAILTEKLDTTLNGSKILVTGYGRTGRAICSVLKGLNVQVTCAARKCSVLAEINSSGMKAIYTKDIAKTGSEYDAVVNTVPSRIINKAEIDSFKDGCCIIEVASAPYGVDIEAATQASIDLVIAGSLPGKVAPKTAGIIIAESIINIIGEGKM